MRQDPLFVLWQVAAPSAEGADRLQKELASTITPDATFIDEVRACPDGKPTVRQESHRFGDYFVSIRVLPPGQPGPTFRLLFQRRSGAGRIWKDLMARVLQQIRRAMPQTTATLAYQGDEEPNVAGAD